MKAQIEILFTIYITIYGFLIVASLLFHVEQKWIRDAMMQEEMQKWKFYSYFQVPKVGLLQLYPPYRNLVPRF